MRRIINKDGDTIRVEGVYPHHAAAIQRDVVKLIHAGDKRVMQWLHGVVAEAVNADNDHAQGLVYDLAHLCAGQVVKRSQLSPLPKWLAWRTRRDHRVPWLMVNGKPAPGYEPLDEAVGHRFIKRGKAQFSAAQTRHVAEVVGRINYLRELVNDAPHWMDEGDEESRKLLKAIARLPDFSRKNAPKWWKVVSGMVRQDAMQFLTTREKKELTRSTCYETDASIANEHLNRCRKAFDSLVPS